MTLSVYACSGPGDYIIHVEGELDVATVEELEQALSGVLSGHQGDLNLDLSRVTFLGSQGVAVLIRCDTRLRAQGHRLRLVACSRQAARVLGLMGLKALMT